MPSHYHGEVIIPSEKKVRKSGSPAMDGLRERSTSWSSRRNSPSLQHSEATDREAPWRDLGSSMSAISFGFVATAILISMFLVMAIFEHLLRRNRGPLLSRDPRGVPMEQEAKIGASQIVVGHFPPDVSVMMPGQNYPTYIAQPAPLPCPREGVFWPSHDHKLPLASPAFP